MTDRFNFENQLMKCWDIVEEVRLLNELVLESDTVTTDQISNYLLGLETIYEAKFEKLYRQFEELIAEGKIK
jgi:hypothetical protein